MRPRPVALVQPRDAELKSLDAGAELAGAGGGFNSTPSIRRARRLTWADTGSRTTRHSLHAFVRQIDGRRGSVTGSVTSKPSIHSDDFVRTRPAECGAGRRVHARPDGRSGSDCRIARPRRPAGAAPSGAAHRAAEMFHRRNRTRVSAEADDFRSPRSAVRERHMTMRAARAARHADGLKPFERRFDDCRQARRRRGRTCRRRRSSGFCVLWLPRYTLDAELRAAAGPV